MNDDPTRRQVLLATGGIATTAIAGCTAGARDPTLTVDLDPTMNPQTLEQFDTLEVRFERLVMHRGNADSVTIDPDDRAIDLAAVDPHQPPRLVQDEPIPPGDYELVDFFLPVTTARLSDGSSASFMGGQITIDLVLGEFPMEVSRGQHASVILMLAPSDSGGNWGFETGFSTSVR